MKNKKFSLGRIMTHAVLIALGIYFLLPFFWMLSTALKGDTELMAMPPVLIPSDLRWDNFARAVQYIPFFSYMGNTAFITLLDVLGTLLVCPLVAYSLSRLEWKGRDLLFFATIAVMMIPNEATMIPTFIVFSKLNLTNTYIPLFIQSFFGRPFMIFLLRQFFMNLPRDLEDAGRIDGAGELAIYARIVLPLVVPGILTVCLFRFMNAWNDFLGPLLYINDQARYTLSIGLQMFTTQYKTEWQLMMAASLMMSLPVILIYFFVQKRFVEGITLTGGK